MKRHAAAEESDDSDGSEGNLPKITLVKRGRRAGATAKIKLEGPHLACLLCQKTYSSQGSLRAHWRDAKHKKEYAAAGGKNAKIESLGELRRGQKVCFALGRLPLPLAPGRPPARRPPARPPPALR